MESGPIMFPRISDMMWYEKVLEFRSLWIKMDHDFQRMDLEKNSYMNTRNRADNCSRL